MVHQPGVAARAAHARPPGRFPGPADNRVSGIAGISQFPFNLTEDGEPERIAGSSVSSSFFDVLGTPALLGDVFHSGRVDERDVVLSHGLWTRRFGPIAASSAASWS